MAKKKNLTKEDLKGPDAFQESAGIVSRFIEKHAKPLGAVALLLIVAGSSYAFYGFYKNKMEFAAQEDLYVVTAKHDILVKPATTPEGEKVAAEKAPEVKKDLSEVSALYEKVISDHKGTKASIIAATKLADLYSEQGDTEKALEVIKTVESKVKPSGLVEGLALMTIGRHYEMSGKCDMAVKPWESVLEAPSLKFLHSEAHLKLGLCYENLNDLDQAKTHYKVLSDDYGDSAAGRTGKRLLSLINSNGEA